MSRVNCPYCGEPLEVQWEVWKHWEVHLVDGNPVLGPLNPDFEGGTCGSCNKWVEPSQVKK